MDALWLELGRSVARAGPHIGGAVLVFSIMAWLTLKRRAYKRGTDEIVLATGAAIVAVLLWKIVM